MPISPADSVTDDVLRNIFALSTQRELVQLSSVNRRFHVLVGPHLYRTIRWTWHKSQIPPIFLLLRSIIARPTLATYIRHLDLQGDSYYYGSFALRAHPKIPRVLSERDWDDMLELITRRDDLTIFVQDLQLPTMDAAVAVLLSLLPNLRTLFLGPNFGKGSDMVGMMVKKAFCEPNDGSCGKLQLLEEVELSVYWDRGNGRNKLLYLPFFYAPCIRRISAMIEVPDAGIEWPCDPPNGLTLTSLSLSHIREEELGEILQHSSKVQSLSYHFQADPDRPSPPPFLSCLKLERSLSYVQSTLTALKISAKFEKSTVPVDSLIPPMGMHGTLTTLPDFGVLEVLEVPIVLLLGWSPESNKKIAKLLPKSTRQLTLTDDFVETNDSDWYEEEKFLVVFREWLEGWRESTPLLEGVHLLLKQEDQVWGPAAREQYPLLGQKFGLDVRVTSVNHS